MPADAARATLPNAHEGTRGSAVAKNAHRERFGAPELSIETISTGTQVMEITHNTQAYTT